MTKNLILSTIIALTALGAGAKTLQANLEVVPLPHNITMQAGQKPFVLNSSTVITTLPGNDLLMRDAQFLADYIAQSTGYRPAVKTSVKRGGSNVIVLAIDPSMGNDEGYRMDVKRGCITIAAKTAQGMFYGVQTLRKAIPAVAQGCDVEIPATVVSDEPRFGYRGMHLDVSRHFFPVEWVKRYIDLLALHNINTLHWHLTDDQGWRIESKRYPRLNEVGAWRDSTVVGYLGSGKYDNTRYGGYYTQDELREVVRYAQERYINIIPEVDLPGHMRAVLAAYPDLGCTGGPYSVSPDWGIFDDVLCAGNDRTMDFLKGVLDEVIGIFPSPYIHIGGDEVPRKRWEQCAKCQARIAQQGITGNDKHSAEDLLQSWVTREIEKYLNGRGRQIIGWDDILKGDLAQSTIIMSGNSREGGLEGARRGHRVITAPNSYYYFDFYQTANSEQEPLAIGGCTTVEKVYMSEPTEGLDDEAASHVWGAQANLWTEYITTTSHAEYMVLPRMAALAEVQWVEKGKKDYNRFLRRLVRLVDVYQRDGYNYAKHIFELKGEFVPDEKRHAMVATISTLDDAPIHYTLDGSEPTAQSTLYTGPINITATAQLRAMGMRAGGNTQVLAQDFDWNKATMKKVTFPGLQPDPSYSGHGPVSLVDGIHGNGNHATGAWLGFVGDELVIELDLGEATAVSEVTVTGLTYMDAWIMGATGYKVELKGADGSWHQVHTSTYPADTDLKKHAIVPYTAQFDAQQTQYLRLTLTCPSSFPEGHAAHGYHPFLFLDEITVK